MKSEIEKFIAEYKEKIAGTRKKILRCEAVLNTMCNKSLYACGEEKLVRLKAKQAVYFQVLADFRCLLDCVEESLG